MITLKWLGCDGLICREIGWREVVKDYVMSKNGGELGGNEGKIEG